MPEAPATIVEPPLIALPASAGMPDVNGYEVIKLLGQGGMGKVYQAQHLKLNRMVALKLVTSASDDHALARFEEEVQAIARLRHPHIAQIYESGQVESRPFYSMEYVTGGTLSERLKTSPLPPRQAAELLVSLAKAMQHAHDQQVLHRDLKPSNILLEEGTLQPKIADFGLAKRLNNDTKLTRTGDIFGSPSYMAPEQASGVMKLTAAVDVYALGAVLYECVTGRPPFMGPDPMQTLMMVITDDPLPPRQMQPKLPRDLNTICMKCLEKQPKKRYASAQALADDLERYLQGLPITARPISGVERLVKWSVRKPWQAVAAGLVVVLFIGLIVGFILMQQAYLDVSKANQESNQAFELSKNTLGETLQDITYKLGSIPNVETLVLELYRPTLKLYQSLDRMRPKDRSTTLDYLKTLYEFGVQQVLYYRYDDAAKTFDEADNVLAVKEKMYPKDFELELQQARFLISRGWLLRRQNKSELARPFEKRAKVLLVALEQQQPKNSLLLRTSNELLQTNINDAIAERQLEEALQYYQLLLSNQENIYKIEPTNDQATMVMSAQKSLGAFLLATQAVDKAAEMFEKVAASLPQLQLSERDRLNLQADVAIAQADIARRKKNWAQAETLFQQAGKSNQKLRQQFPIDANYLYQELDIRCKAAELLHDQGQVEQACRALQQYVADTEKIVKENPRYTSIASQLQHYRKVLEKYQSEITPPGK